MGKIHHLVLGTAVLACSQLAAAQSGPAPQIEAAPVAGATVPPAPLDHGAPSSGGVATGEQGSVPGVVVGTIIQTRPPTQTESAGTLSNDPYVQRREALAQARAEYRARVDAARREYREDRRAADAMLAPRSGG